MSEALTDAQHAVAARLAKSNGGLSTSSLAASLGVSNSAIRNRIAAIKDRLGEDVIQTNTTGQRVWCGDDDLLATDGGADPAPDPVDEDAPPLPDFSETTLGEDPTEADLTERERYILTQLPTGVTVETLADDIGARPSIVTQHLRDLREDGWKVYVDETAELVTIEGDHTLRSSEHTGTRTRKANRWWERRHNDLVREFKSLQTPTAEQNPTRGSEDWVLHLTDVHAGDRVRLPDGTNIYNKACVPAIVRYITEKSLELAEYHGTGYDTGHILLGGDEITGEGTYEGMFEDLDAWLDEQVDMLFNPFLELIKAYAERFDTVNLTCVVGNHGEIRANGTSRQVNADLLLYKSIRNHIARLKEDSDNGLLDNVNINIPRGRAYCNFQLRGGTLLGHLRHGQHRSPQADTSARKKEWLSTLIDHEFDVTFAGHHHVSGTVPWDGPPIIFSGSSKPPGQFVEKIAASAQPDPRKGPREIATCASFADHGLTARYPVKTHDFDYIETSKQTT